MQNNPLDMTFIILTYNEEVHINRCLQSIHKLAKEIYIIDSFSNDKTLEIATKYENVKVFQNAWPGNHAKQINWALDNCEINTAWVMRLDADEFLLPELIEEMYEKLEVLEDDINGIYLKRRVYFLDKWIKYGGYYPISFLRIWRNGFGICENRWMDEHILVSEGRKINFENDFVDYNLNGLHKWTEKHNGYASKELIDLLLKTNSSVKFNFINFLKDGIYRKQFLRSFYSKFPLFIRPIIYFHYRYLFKLGFLDGKRGFIWHFLQGFWYRFYIDAKFYEVRHFSGKDIKENLAYIEKKYGVSIDE